MGLTVFQFFSLPVYNLGMSVMHTNAQLDKGLERIKCMFPLSDTVLICTN